MSEPMKPAQYVPGWPEDATHENGEYQCLCLLCNRMFIGHKRRQYCKSCAEVESWGPSA